MRSHKVKWPLKMKMLLISKTITDRVKQTQIGVSRFWYEILEKLKKKLFKIKILNLETIRDKSEMHEKF